MKGNTWIIITLVVMNSALLFVMTKRGSSESDTAVDKRGRKIEGHHSLDEISSTLIFVHGDDFGLNRKPTTLFVFHGGDSDCMCLDDCEWWLKAHKTDGETINICSIFNGDDHEKSPSFVEEIGLPFPAYIDSERKNHRLFNIKHDKVIKAFVASDGYVLFIGTNTKSRIDQRNFPDRLDEHVN